MIIIITTIKLWSMDTATRINNSATLTKSCWKTWWTPTTCPPPTKWTWLKCRRCNCYNKIIFNKAKIIINHRNHLSQATISRQSKQLTTHFKLDQAKEDRTLPNLRRVQLNTSLKNQDITDTQQLVDKTSILLTASSNPQVVTLMPKRLMVAIRRRVEASSRSARNIRASLERETKTKL